MAIIRKRVLSSLNAHWAIVDLLDRNGNVVVPAGKLKTIEVRYADLIEEDGVPIHSTIVTSAERASDPEDPRVREALGLALADVRVERDQLRTRVSALESEREALTREVAQLRTTRTITGA